MKFIIKLTVIFFIILSIGCSESEKKDGIKEGYIIYKISYSGNELENISPSMLPKRMYLEFNKDFTINTIEGFMGFFKLSNYTSLKNKKSLTRLKVIDKNYLFESKRNEQICCFDEMIINEIVITEEEKTIAGFSCKKAIAFLENKEDTIEFFYTDDILLDKPNAVNPYHKIDGVLMEFNLYLNNINMRFTAHSYENKEIEKEDFTRQDDYKTVSRQQMTEVLTRLLN
jgi:hypothetical protein